MLLRGRALGIVVRGTVQFRSGVPVSVPNRDNEAGSVERRLISSETKFFSFGKTQRRA